MSRTQLDRTPWPRRVPVPGFAYGGDYNPEQWSRSVVSEDMELMRRAGVNLVTLGVFSWIMHEPHDGEFDFTWIDDMLDLLHENGIRVDLGTATAAVPMWLHRLHPQILPQDEFGHPLAPGGRMGWCPSSQIYRDYSLRLVDRLAEHVAGHPAIAMWHVSNEFGGGNARCHCPVSGEHFRRWLQQRYGDVAALNDAWGMSVWGNRYSSFEEVTPPSGRTTHNPGHLLDFERFSSEALLEQYRAEREVLRRYTDLPITTNFMVSLGPDVVDYARWAPEMDIVANDHYTHGDDPRRHEELAFAGDRMRGLAGGAPWMLMEHATGGASWYDVNTAKEPGELARHAFGHVARGSDAVMFFQWRASACGAEQFHSAMLGHAGERSRIFRQITTLGEQLTRIAAVAGSRVERPRVAMLHDNEAGWALRSGLRPVNGMEYARSARAYHGAFFDRGIVIDIVPPWSSLDGYDLVVVPGLFLATPQTAHAVADVAARGGTVLVTWFSGIVDENCRVLTGGHPGAFRDLLGITGDEFMPLIPGKQIALDNGWTGSTWSELVYPDDAQVIARYRDGAAAGEAAITRRAVTGGGNAWYVSTDLDPQSLDALIGQVLQPTTIRPVVGAAPGVEAVRRVSADARYLFLINHNTEHAGWADACGVDLLTGTRHRRRTPIAPGGVVVLEED